MDASGLGLRWSVGVGVGPLRWALGLSLAAPGLVRGLPGRWVLASGLVSEAPRLDVGALGLLRGYTGLATPRESVEVSVSRGPSRVLFALRGLAGWTLACSGLGLGNRFLWVCGLGWGVSLQGWTSGLAIRCGPDFGVAGPGLGTPRLDVSACPGVAASLGSSMLKWCSTCVVWAVVRGRWVVHSSPSRLGMVHFGLDVREREGTQW